jgi:hypothetical protein
MLIQIQVLMTRNTYFKIYIDFALKKQEHISSQVTGRNCKIDKNPLAI